MHFTPAHRALYATDASNYRQVPIGVVVPRNVEDVIATVTICRKFGVPLLSRGGGTSLAGQTCNSAVVMDFSRHLNAVQELDPKRRLATVEPGVVLDTLRAQAEAHQLTFAPDPATHNRCTLGGMIGNNSCGIHALMGGKTVDNIRALDILLYDGTRLTVGETSEVDLERFIAEGGRKGEIYFGLKRIRDTYHEVIRQRFPAIPRRVSGYNLDQLLPENRFNVARALVGSEGTCVTVLKAICELKPSPQYRRLVALGFPDAFIAADHVPSVLELEPIGLEGFDGLLIDYMRRKKLALNDIALLPKGAGFLLCEFGADSQCEAENLARALLKRAATFSHAPHAILYSPHEAERVWNVRESALGASVFVPGEKTGWEGWEDSAVPPKYLGVYLRDLFHLINEFGYTTPMYGHFGQGCVHLRIDFDFATYDGIQRFRSFIEQATEIVLRYGGSVSGEHGDGQARACLLPKMFGAELMQAFKEFKALWDPSNKMNPGKLVDPIAVFDATENLRPSLVHPESISSTEFTFHQDHGSFELATSRCVGVGACRKEDHGTMCPSFMATREEKYSTRGRAHLLWEMFQGSVIKGKWSNEEVKEALDTCLSCKACKSECPASVDMATWKAEFLNHHYAGKLHPLSHYAFGFMDRLAAAASIAPEMANLPLRVPALGNLIKMSLGIAPQRELPKFAPRSFRSSYRPHNSRQADPEILLWPDTWNNYFSPSSLHAAAQVLAAAGKRISIPSNHICCGRPLYDFGFLRAARKYLERILKTFEPQIRSGVPVVFLEPSCASVFKDELLNFFPNDERAILLSKQAVLFSEYMLKSGWQPPRRVDQTVIFHAHCHQKSIFSIDSDLELMRSAGASIEVLDSGCCGMAGPFGFEKRNFTISQSLAERVLLPSIRSSGQTDTLISNGFSCREQIAQNSTRKAVHLAEFLADEPC